MKNIILLIIQNEEKERWHYLAVKNYLHYCIKKRQGDFYCLNCLNSFRTENKLMSHEKVCKIKISKILHNKIFHEKCISHKNEKNASINELFRIINIRFN